MMQLHLDEIARKVAEGAHAVLLLDRAGWHTTSKLAMPENITPIFLPSRASELNPVENVRRYLRRTALQQRIRKLCSSIHEASPCLSMTRETAF
jgi:transposase